MSEPFDALDYAGLPLRKDLVSPVANRCERSSESEVQTDQAVNGNPTDLDDLA